FLRAGGPRSPPASEPRGATTRSLGSGTVETEVGEPLQGAQTSRHGAAGEHQQGPPWPIKAEPLAAPLLGSRRQRRNRALQPTQHVRITDVEVPHPERV